MPLPGARRHKRSRVWTVLLVAVLAGGGWWYWQQSRQAEVANEPLLATVAVGSIENTITAAGTLKPSRFVDVGAQVSGMLQKLHVDVGDVVTENDLLAEIDARVQEARVEGSRASILAQEAQLEARKAALALAKANAERQERLRADNASSQLEYDNAVNNLASAESSLTQLQKQIEQSRASLNSEETQLEFTRIFAPSSGTVVSVEMNEGRTLNANQSAPTILRIADLRTMTVEAAISEADISRLKPGMDVYFTTLGGGSRRWYAKLRQILPTPVVTNNVVLYTGLFDVENNDGALLSEMTAQVYFITSAAENVLTVPIGAVHFPDPQQLNAARMAEMAASAGGSPSTFTPPPGFTPPAGARPGAFVVRNEQDGPRPATVTVVNPDGTQEERDVVIGVTSRVSAEVISGLNEGEQVVAGILQPEDAAQASQDEQRGPNIRIGGGFRG